MKFRARTRLAPIPPVPLCQKKPLCQEKKATDAPTQSLFLL